MNPFDMIVKTQDQQSIVAIADVRVLEGEGVSAHPSVRWKSGPWYDFFNLNEFFFRSPLYQVPGIGFFGCYTPRDWEAQEDYAQFALLAEEIDISGFEAVIRWDGAITSQETYYIEIAQPVG